MSNASAPFFVADFGVFVFIVVRIGPIVTLIITVGLFVVGDIFKIAWVWFRRRCGIHLAHRIHY